MKNTIEVNPRDNLMLAVSSNLLLVIGVVMGDIKVEEIILSTDTHNMDSSWIFIELFSNKCTSVILKTWDMNRVSSYAYTLHYTD